MIVRLPRPISTNGLFKTAGRRRYKSAAYEAWIAAADRLLMTQKRTLRRVAGPYDILIRVPKSRMDVDNAAKAIIDFCVSRELTDDDKHARKVTVQKADGLDCCEVIITSPAETIRAGEG